MKKTGQLLKTAREGKNLSLNEVSLALKINSRILKAIEDGGPENLPATTFLRGFVKSYATFLKINNVEFMQTFTEELGLSPPQEPSSEVGAEQDSTISTVSERENPSPKKFEVRKHDPPPLNEPSGRPNALYILLATVIIIAIFFLKKMIDRYEKESQVGPVTVEHPSGDSPIMKSTTIETTTKLAHPSQENTSDKIPLNSSNLAAKTDLPSPSNHGSSPEVPADTSKSLDTPQTPDLNEGQRAAAIGGGDSVTAPGLPAIAKTAPDNPSTVKSQPASNKQEPKPVNIEESAKVRLQESKPTENAISPANDQQATNSAHPPPPNPSSLSRNVEIVVEALDGVEIEYSTNNSKAEKIILKADQVYTLKSRSGMRLNISNGGAVNLFVNGKDMGVPGDLGKPIKLNY